MNKLIDKLPREVVDIIIGYTYNLQPIQLRNDIISFVNTKQNIINIFKLRYYDLKVDINKHLSFHIYHFLIGQKNIYAECKNKIYEISKRNYLLNNNNCDYLKNIFFKSCYNIYIFKIYWGLLTPEERNHFIDIQKRMDTERQP